MSQRLLFFTLFLHKYLKHLNQHHNHLSPTSVSLSERKHTPHKHTHFQCLSQLQWQAIQELFQLLCYCLSSATLKLEKSWLEARQMHGKSHPLNLTPSINGLKVLVFSSATLLVTSIFNPYSWFGFNLVLGFSNNMLFLSQCGNMTVGKTQSCKWTRKTMLAAILQIPLKSTRMGTPRWSLTDLVLSTSSAEARDTVRRVRSLLWWFFLQDTGTLVFLQHLLRWSLTVQLLLQLAVLQSCRVVWWLHWGSLLWACSEGDSFDCQLLNLYFGRGFFYFLYMMSFWYLVWSRFRLYNNIINLYSFL